MPSTITTTTITTSMASNDIPILSTSNNEVVAAAAAVNGEATSLPSPALWSCFVHGEKEDRVLETFSDMGIMRITSRSAMVEGPHDALVSRNSATTKHPI